MEFMELGGEDEIEKMREGSFNEYILHTYIQDISN